MYTSVSQPLIELNCACCD